MARPLAGSPGPGKHSSDRSVRLSAARSGPTRKTSLRPGLSVALNVRWPRASVRPSVRSPARVVGRASARVVGSRPLLDVCHVTDLMMTTGRRHDSPSRRDCSVT